MFKEDDWITTGSFTAQEMASSNLPEKPCSSREKVKNTNEFPNSKTESPAPMAQPIFRTQATKPRPALLELNGHRTVVMKSHIQAVRAQVWNFHSI